MPEVFSSTFGGYLSEDDGSCCCDVLVSEETRFPTAMSYASDAQRSDVATVCSNSVGDEIEVESVFSQDDNIGNNHNNNKMSSSLATTTTWYRVCCGGSSTSYAYPGFNNGAVMIREPPVASYYTSFSTPTTRFQDRPHVMGPPLNRTLAIDWNSPSSSVKSFGSMGSDGEGTSTTVSSPCLKRSNSVGGGIAMQVQTDNETCSIGMDSTQEDVASVSRHLTATSLRNSALFYHHNGPLLVQGSPSSVKSAGSDNTGVDADSDVDCGNSLDVETNSVGTRSIHSQEDYPIDSEPGSVFERPPLRQECPELVHLNVLRGAPEVNGRRSPGGTIYKGRGKRRYQGRYMHLPLKRFQQNGVHLDADTVTQPQVMIGSHHEGTKSGDYDERQRKSCKHQHLNGERPSRSGFHAHGRRSDEVVKASAFSGPNDFSNSYHNRRYQRAENGKLDGVNHSNEILWHRNGYCTNERRTQRSRQIRRWSHTRERDESRSRSRSSERDCFTRFHNDGRFYHEPQHWRYP